MKLQRGFTLIELMVVIVIIGILSALAVPKMFGTSAKAKAAEAPNIIANWETLESAYTQESGAAGSFAQIGFKQPGNISSATHSSTKWFDYDDVGATATGASMTATVVTPFGDCAATDNFESDFTTIGDVVLHVAQGTCATAYARNYLP